MSGLFTDKQANPGNPNIAQYSGLTAENRGNKSGVKKELAWMPASLRKVFRVKCQEFLYNIEDPFSAFHILKSIAIGYKGCKPSDRLNSIALVAKIAGEMHDKLEIEHKNPFEGIDDKTLISAAGNLVDALKSKNGEVKDVKIIESDNGQSQSDNGGSGEKEGKGAV